jgi:hypothetical protein
MAAPTATRSPLDWVGDRIKDFRRVPPARIKLNPCNWRRHGPDQQRAMQGLLQRLGYVNALLVREIDEPPYEYELIDGEMRLGLSQSAPTVPVLVLDVSEAEADLILATYDPVGDLVIKEAQQADALAHDVWTEDESVNTVLLGLLQNSHTPTAASDQPATPHTYDLAPLPYEHYDYVVLLTRTTLGLFAQSPKKVYFTGHMSFKQLIHMLLRSWMAQRSR